jgi:sulfur carrier protein
VTVHVNGEERLVRPGATVHDLVEDLGVPPRGVAVAVDHVVVPRSAWARTVVPVGSRVEVVTALQGG